MKHEKADPKSHFKMTKQSKIVSANFLNAHERGVWLRQMMEAEMAAEAYRRKSLKQKGEKLDD